MLSFNLQTPYRILSQYFDNAIDNAIGTDAFETHGVTLKLQRRGDSFFNVDGRVIFINTIADIEVYKDVGLFSSEITGVIDINLAVEYDIDGSFRLTTKSEILNYKWIEKPKLEIGALNMPVEKLVELALKHYESIITAKIDASIRANIDLKKLVDDQIDSLNNVLADNTFHGLSASVIPTHVYLMKPAYIDGIIYVKGGINVKLSIGDKNSNESDSAPVFEWVEKLSIENLVLADFELSQRFLKSVIGDLISKQRIGGKQVQVEQLVVEILDKVVAINAKMISPVVGSLKLTAIPQYAEANQSLDLIDVDFDLKPDGFIYKLSAPLVNKFVESKVNEIFPLDIGEIIRKNINNILPKNISTKVGELRPTVKAIKLEKLGTINNKIKGRINIQNPFLEINMGVE